MDFHVLTPKGMAHILSTNLETNAMSIHTPRPYAEIAAARTAAIKAGAPLVAKLECWMCGWRLGKGALYCSAACADDFAQEKKALLGVSLAPDAV